MKRITKKRLIVAGIIFLVAINLAALTTMLARQRQQAETIERQNMADSLRRAKANRFIRDELQLSPQQFEQFRALSRENFQQSRPLLDQMEIKRAEMLEELAKPKPDHEKLDQIALEIGNLHTELKKNTIDHFLQLKTVCTPAQQQGLNALFREILYSRGHRQPPGRGHRHRHRHGRGGPQPPFSPTHDNFFNKNEK